MKIKKMIAFALSAILCTAAFMPQKCEDEVSPVTAFAEGVSDMPSDYKTACDWIWQNRIEKEGSMKDWSTIYDQIVAGNGTLQYILIWQSYEKITLEQRQKLPQMLEDAVNQWTDNLIGYDDWPFEHVKVKVVGYAVLDKSCLLDLQPDEVVYTDTTNSWLRDDMIGSMGDESIPVLQPAEPTDISRYVHWADNNWSYNGSYDNRYDMYLHGIKGMINMGGYGYHYGQILSDQSILGLVNNTTSQHILLHEMGHGFGFPDYYGGEGESDGFPPGGFPGGENSIMMAGSCSYINSFDQWFLKYSWSKLKAESGRFDLSAVQPGTTETTTTTVTTTTTTETTTTTTTTTQPVQNTKTIEFTDTIASIDLNDNGGTLTFENNGTFTFSGTDYFAGDESKNLAHYEANDKISIRFTYNTDTGAIINIESLSLESNAHKVRGDVNSDGVFNISDVVLLQKWLIAAPETNLADWQAGDLSEDGKLNVSDLCIMKHMLISVSST